MSDDRPSLEPTIEVRSPQPGVVLVVLSGEHDLTSADELRQTFDQSLSRCDHLIVDLSPAEFIDSTTIRVLMGTRKHAIERDREFTVVLGTATIVERALEISGMLTLVNVVPTVERALADSVDSTTARVVARSNERGRCLSERFANALAGKLCDGVAVELAHQLAAVLMAEMQRDLDVTKTLNVEGAPAEVVSRHGV